MEAKGLLMPTPQQSALSQIIKKHPTLVAALLGGAIGAPTGALFSDEGAEARGGLQGALLGAGAGAGGGMLARGMAKAAPSPAKALLVGGALGGAVGGVAGQRRLSPWVIDNLKQLTQGGSKEATDMSQESGNGIDKAAMDKEAVDRTNAFDGGMDEFCRVHGIDKAQLSKAANVANPEELAGATIAWLSEQAKAAE